MGCVTVPMAVVVITRRIVPECARQRRWVTLGTLPAIGCVVFRDQQYVGCLVIQPRAASPVDIVAGLDRQTSRGSCEKLG
jgi:hypothetical protein